MIRFITSFSIMVLLSFTNAETTSTSLVESLKARVHGRQLGHHRKLLSVDDPTIVLDGQFIVIFDNDAVKNVTEKVEDLFVKNQIVYEYDNIAVKGVAIRNMTDEQLNRLEGDSDIVYIAPVRI